MKKKPKPARQPVKPGTVIPGGPMQPVPARHAHHPVARKAAPRPGIIIPGGPMQTVPAKTVARKKPVKRKLALGEAVACCSAQALGTLLGWDWQQMLSLYWRTAAGPDSGASIEETLAAAGMPAVEVLNQCQPFSAGPFHFRGRPAVGIRDGDLHLVPVGHGLILGAALPEPHALAVTPDGRWWSWGDLYDPADFPGAVIEEAWQVTW